MDRFHYCPQCGQASLAGDQRRVACQRCDFVFYLNAASAAAAILQREGRILFTVRAREPQAGTWDLPGGFIEHEETAEDALVREVREELNISITDLRFFGTFPNRYPYKGIVYPVLDCVFTARVGQWDSLEPQDDVKDVIFVPPDQVDLSRIAFASTRQAIREFLDRSGPADSTMPPAGS
ncbi:MAG: NUDIX hydrolase [Sedimentisphaerales bacterium]|nr:NUDIX hydrolase [Sedimentisphaerales bacterium]